MRNGKTDLTQLVAEHATDAIAFFPGNGRPPGLPRENYYDFQTGWPLNPKGVGKKYLALATLLELKLDLLSGRSAATKADAAPHLQRALEIVLQALGEVDGDAQ